MSISTRLTLLVAGALSVFVAIGGALVAYAEIEFADQRASVHGVLLGRVIASSVRESRQARGELGARDMVAAINAHEPSVEVRLVHFGDDDPGALAPRALDDVQREKLREGRIVTSVSAAGRDERFTYVPVTGTGRGIEIAESQEARDAHVRSMMLRLASLVLAGVAASLVLALVAGQRLVGEPVSRLVALTERVGAGDLTSRAPAGRTDEIGLLGAAMNRMLDDLSEARAQVAREEGVRRQAEEQLQHAERLSTLGQLAAGVAHEIGTPLQSISMRAALVEELLEDEPGVTKHLQGIQAQCLKIRDIVQSLLRFGRKNEPRSGRVGVSEVVRDTMDLVRVAVPGAEQILVEDSGESPCVQGDHDQLVQVLTNLVMNALHASESPADVKISIQQHDGSVRVRVEDRGVGIPPEVLPHLFEPFFTTKAAGEGTGLGLPISYGIVRDHGGHIDVQSEVGVGSCFDVFLPLAGEDPI